MPQASDAQRARMIERFGSVGDAGPIDFLEGRGYELTGAWEWIAPRPDFTVDEVECIEFLVDEWDYGYVAAIREVQP